MLFIRSFNKMELKKGNILKHAKAFRLTLFRVLDAITSI